MPGIVTTRFRVVLLAGVTIAALVAAVVALVWTISSGPADRTAPGSRQRTPVGAGSSGSAAPGPVAPSASTTRPVPTAGPTAPTTPRGTAAATDPATGSAAASGFLTELGAIDPALVTDPVRALQAGQDTCRDLGGRDPDAAVIRAAAQRFAVGGAVVNEATASLLVDAARNHLCP